MMPRRLRSILITLAVAILLLAGLTAFSASVLLGMLHIPRTVMADLPNTEVVQIESRDHLKLKAAWLASTASGPTPGRCVLFLHGAGGWRGRSQRFTPWLLPAGYSVLAPDLRAQGESGGDTITYGLLEQYDTLDWTSWMHQHGCTKIFAMGESMGASILLMTAGLDPSANVFAAIVAECPFADLLEAAQHRGQSMFPLPAVIVAPLARLAVASGSSYVQLTAGLDLTTASPVAAIAKLQTPVLLIHGLADTNIPPS
ncbi:MAG: alpha/beta fold hydrolase, partial [Acidobacteriota bacterium]